MSKSITARQKRRGRPPTGVTPSVTIRLPAALLEGVDKLASDQGISRTDVMKTIVEHALSAQATTRKTK